jgi:tripartite-type tricarboxylate transporter receptor subunit TctC
MIIQSIIAEKNLDIAMVPTQGGSGMVPLLLAGELDFAYSGGIHATYTESGDMKVIAALTTDRQPAYPDVPTLAEFGFDVNMDDYRMIAVPADTPADVVATLETALEAAAADPAFVDLTENTLKFTAVFISGTDLTDILAVQRESYLPLVEAFKDQN